MSEPIVIGFPDPVILQNPDGSQWTITHAAVADSARQTVIYCRGCRKAWHDDGIGFGDGECSCICTDEAAPHYEDWVIDPPVEAIPEGAWE